MHILFVISLLNRTYFVYRLLRKAGRLNLKFGQITNLYCPNQGQNCPNFQTNITRPHGSYAYAHTHPGSILKKMFPDFWGLFRIYKTVIWLTFLSIVPNVSYFLYFDILKANFSRFVILRNGSFWISRYSTCTVLPLTFRNLLKSLYSRTGFTEDFEGILLSELSKVRYIIYNDITVWGFS